MVIPVVNGALGTVLRDMLKRLEESKIGRQTETIQIAALLRSARLPRSCCCSDSSERQLAKEGVNK